MPFDVSPSLTVNRPSPNRLAPAVGRSGCAASVLSSESRRDRRVRVADVTLVANVAQATRGAAVRASTGAAATPTTRPAQAELRPRITRISPRLARVLFMSRTVHSPTAGKPAQLLGRAAKKSGTRPVRSGALSAPAGARSSGRVTGRRIEAGRPRSRLTSYTGSGAVPEREQGTSM